MKRLYLGCLTPFDAWMISNCVLGGVRVYVRRESLSQGGFAYNVYLRLDNIDRLLNWTWGDA